MRQRPDQLAAHLRKALSPLYLVYGEEPLQAQEAADAIRAAARERGYSERECLTVETGFDWDTPVSYTHLDVYKRQFCTCFIPGSGPRSCAIWV